TLRNAELNGWMYLPDTLNVDASSRWNMFADPDNPAFNPAYATTSHGTAVSFAGEINLAAASTSSPARHGLGPSGGTVLVANNLNGQGGMSSVAGVMAKLPPQHTLTLRNAELNGWMYLPDTLNVDASSRWNMFADPD
ncbi:hypothetical protein CTI14_41575, partial [Methylobacterium radiotolerans]